MKYCANLKQSLDDNRDYVYNNDSIVNLPEIIDYRSDLMPIRDQGSQGTCYAQSVACMKEWQEKKDYGFNEYFSPQFFYNNRFNKYDTDITNDDGMYGRDVMKLLQLIGICKENEYPYGIIEHRDNIDEILYSKAKNHIIASYSRIYTIDNLKKSLYLNGPCLIGFPVYNYSDQLWLQKDEDILLGGHAMTIVGYNREGFIIRNSWGKFWGKDGYTIYKYEDWGIHWEIWTTIDDSSNKKNDKKDIDNNQSEEIEDLNNNDSDEVKNNKETYCSKWLKKLLKILN